MRDEVSTEMMSDSVSNMIDDMKQLIVFTNQLKSYIPIIKSMLYKLILLIHKQRHIYLHIYLYEI
jgi:hypothetical protein